MRPESRTYSFGPFRLDSGRRTLSRGPDPVWLTPRSMRALLVLVENTGRLVHKQDLTEAAWPSVAVTDNSICQVITELRKKLGPRENGTPHIETEIRKGYRFVAPVESGPPPGSNGHQPDVPPANRPTSMTAEVARALLEPYLRIGRWSRVARNAGSRGYRPRAPGVRRLEDSNHVYGRERLANTWYALGALALRQNRDEEARAAFQEAQVCAWTRAGSRRSRGRSRTFVQEGRPARSPCR